MLGIIGDEVITGELGIIVPGAAMRVPDPIIGACVVMGGAAIRDPDPTIGACVIGGCVMIGACVVIEGAAIRDPEPIAGAMEREPDCAFA